MDALTRVREEPRDDTDPAISCPGADLRGWITGGPITAVLSRGMVDEVERLPVGVLEDADAAITFLETALAD